MKSTFLGDTRRRGVYARYFLAWTAFGLFYFSQGRIQRSLAHDPTPWWRDLVTWMTGMYICAALTPVILWLANTFPIDRKNWPKRAGLHLVFSIGFSVMELAVHSAVIVWLNLIPATATSYPARVPPSDGRGISAEHPDAPPPLRCSIRPSSGSRFRTRAPP